MIKITSKKAAFIGLIGLIGLIAQISLLYADQASEASPTTANYAQARLFNNAGVDFVSQAKYEEASKEFEKALAADSNFHIARYNLALAYYNMGKTKEAIKEFEYLINSSYYFVNAHYNLGTIYLRQDMTDKAVEQLKVVTELQPNHAEAHFNLGFIYFKKDMIDDSIKEYQKGLQIRPDMVKGHLSLAFIYEKKGMYKEAIAEYTTALNLDPKDQDIIQALGGAKAIFKIKEDLKTAKPDAQSYIFLGHIYYARGMYREAADSYNQALQYEPGNEAAKVSSQKAVVQMVESQQAKEQKKHENPDPEPQKQ